MQKFTTFYQAGFENVQNFSIFTCMFSSGWGPYPNLKVLLCEKMHDHLESLVAPDGPRLPCQEFGLWPGVPLKSTESFFITTFCYDFYQAVPFGHWQLVLIHIFLRISSLLLFENVKKQEGTSVKPLAAWEGMLWGMPHITCPQKFFFKKLQVRKSKNF